MIYNKDIIRAVEYYLCLDNKENVDNKKVIKMCINIKLKDINYKELELIL